MQSNPSPAVWPPSSALFTRAQAEPLDATPTLVMALAEADVERLTLDAFSRRVARTTVEVLTLLSKERPAAVVVDIDAPALDGLAICQAAHASDATAVLATMSAPDTVPALLKAG